MKVEAFKQNELRESTHRSQVENDPQLPYSQMLQGPIMGNQFSNNKLMRIGLVKQESLNSEYLDSQMNNSNSDRVSNRNGQQRIIEDYSLKQYQLDQIFN
ncbi:UNKNOWN [Stylonychia lemnae]|uniref:Uncharacterized protein n=1 Tax=Stylonychia lemnae TaxID=5949 RepID=A0A078AG25_STYLE|nr:UNKNOWN [Stylonychia lemnae]|eukprot:CDW80806.1 UNKNOWN [Stylonychia lemnae]